MGKIFIMVLVVTIVFVFGKFANADSGQLPNFLSYQSALFDDGGNPIVDGKADVTFRIKGLDDQLLYEEKQNLDVVKGQIIALVGNGFTSDGAPTGGIPFAIFDPIARRYLEVEVNGFPPTESMEIASVPYAIYSANALAVAKNSVGSEAIVDGSISYEDLSADLIAKFVREIVGEKGVGEIVFKDDLVNLYREPNAAKGIGVKSGFIYSGANDLQGVLQDMDLAIKRRDELIKLETDEREKNLSTEAASRKETDTQLQTNLTTETTARQKDTDQLNLNISTEVATRQNETSQLSSSISTEAATRQNETSQLSLSISTEAATRQNETGQLQTNILAEINNRQTALSQETSARQSVDAGLQSSISAESSARDEADSKIRNEMIAETLARQNVDAGLQSSISAESSARDGADSEIRNELAAETLARQNVDAGLQSSITAESSARIAFDSRIISDLIAETSARQTEDVLIRAQYQQLSDIVTPLTEQIHPSAWGTLYEDAIGPATLEIHGIEASATYMGGAYRVTFAQPMESANSYIVIASGRYPGQTGNAVVDKSANGFTIVRPPTDFIIVGH